MSSPEECMLPYIPEGYELIKPSVSDCCVAATVVHAFTSGSHCVSSCVLVWFFTNGV